MTPARARTKTARSGVEHTNHEATAPPMISSSKQKKRKKKKILSTEQVLYDPDLKRFYP